MLPVATGGTTTTSRKAPAINSNSSGSIASRKAIAGALQPGIGEALLSPTAAAPAVS